MNKVVGGWPILALLQGWVPGIRPVVGGLESRIRGTHSSETHKGMVTSSGKGLKGRASPAGLRLTFAILTIGGKSD